MATIKDIAKEAGVSVATVSHVVNKTRYVSPELQQKVEDAIKRADVPPNFVIKKKQKSNSELEPEYYLFLSSKPGHPYHLQIAENLRLLADKRNAAFISVDISGYKKTDLLEGLFSRDSKLKGVFVAVDVATHPVISLLENMQVPLVVIGGKIGNIQCDRVTSANYEGAYKGVMHLVRSGHEKIALLGESEDTEITTERIKGYRKALEDNHLEIRDDYIACDMKNEEDIFKKMDSFIFGDNRPTAVFVINYNTMYYTYKYMEAHNVKCPDDISLIGFSDFPWAELVSPQLTTVSQNVEEISEKAFKLMSERINGDVNRKPELIQIDTKLQVRNSTAGIGRGPFGEKAGSVDDLIITEDEIEKCRDGRYTAAISFHYSGRSWNLLQEKGIRKVFDKLGISIIAVLDANFDPELQSRQIRSLKLLEPDILISFPTDTKKTAEAFQEFRGGKTKMLFISGVPEGFTHDDYVSCVSVNEHSYGRSIGRGLGEYMRKMHLTKVGIIRHKADDFYATRQRDMSGIQILKEEYPELEICDMIYFEKEEDTYELTKQMINRHPEIEGLYVSWEDPARYVIQALVDIGRDDIAISTGDLEYNLALNMAKGGMIKAISAQCPYDQGKAIAKCAAMALLDKPVPSYVGIEPISVNQYNLTKAWNTVYKEDLPQEIKKSLNWAYLK